MLTRADGSQGTHGDAILGILMFDRFVAAISDDALASRLAWVASIRTPNMVCHGTFRSMISKTLGDDHRVTHTGKFPGYACHVVDEHGVSSTAEVFLNGRLVLPGMKSPGGLKRALALICDIVRPHLIDARPAPG